MNDIHHICWLGLNPPSILNLANPQVEKALIRMAWSKSLKWADVERLLRNLGTNTVRLLGLLKNNSHLIEPERLRSLWMIAAHMESIVYLTIPQTFLAAKEEKLRTQAYAFCMAYALSKNLAQEYWNKWQLGLFYNELPNVLIAGKALHKLWIPAHDVFESYPADFSFLQEGQECVSTLKSWAEKGWIVLTPEIKELFEPFTLRLIVSR